MATQKELAAHLDLTDRAVRELFDKGVLPGDRKSPDIDACRTAYIRNLRERAAGRDKPERDPAAPDPDVELALMRREQRELIRTKRLKAQGQLVSRADFVTAFSGVVGRVKSYLLKLPKTMRAPLAAATDPTEVQELLDAEIRRALDELASTPVEEGSEGDDLLIEEEDLADPGSGR